MNQKMLVRYLILVGVLIICAGAVWYIRSTSEQPAEDAVLAEVPVENSGMEVFTPEEVAV